VATVGDFRPCSYADSVGREVPARRASSSWVSPELTRTCSSSSAAPITPTVYPIRYVSGFGLARVGPGAPLLYTADRPGNHCCTASSSASIHSPLPAVASGPLSSVPSGRPVLPRVTARSRRTVELNTPSARKARCHSRSSSSAGRSCCDSSSAAVRRTLHTIWPAFAALTNAPLAWLDAMAVPLMARSAKSLLAPKRPAASSI